MSILTSWPREHLCLTSKQRREATERVEAEFSSTLKSLKIDIGLVEMLEAIYVPLGAWIYEKKQQKRGPLIIGINGAQGAGKSTLFTLLEVTLAEGFGQRVVGFSLDDIYKTRADRLKMAEQVHPLFVTRGVPGTHDVELGLNLLHELRSARPDKITKIPVFDKSIDDRCPESVWQEWIGTADIVILDGWCLGAQPQSDESLQQPINTLEEQEDPDGRWREYVNEELKGNYSRLFNMMDLLLMLKVPSMESVFEWRTLQEKKLAERIDHSDSNSGEPLRIMGESEIRHFIMHYERLTREMLERMPEKADATLHLNENHKIDRIQINQ
ncbi:MAG: hypothetical protein OQK12_10325, partial [Motiliproteus sp.]|nr:hypothetical protein [Motiliproteus sp.]